MASLAALFALGWWVGRGGASGGVYAHLDLFVDVLHKIEDHYVDPVEPARLVDGALEGMLRDLDPYSQYLDQKSYSNLQVVTEGKFSGIGVVVSVRDEFPTVISPIEGGPAWEAGIHSGDIIVRVDGKSSLGFSIEETANRLRGAEGTEVAISIRREGEEAESEYTLVRREIVTKSVPYAFVLDQGVGYLRLAHFSENTSREVRAAIARLRQAGARSLILDLRLNPGGLLEQAVDVAEQFLPRGALVVYTQGRGGSQDSRYHASDPNGNTRMPMVVLADEGSASASEIVAGALQDRDRALIVGRTTFGKGSVQSVFPIRGKTAALKLTTALYYTPSGRSIHRLDRDTTAVVSDDDDGEVDSAPAAPPDSIARPQFLTAGGRKVFGGGGITPDLEILPDSLPPLTAQVEQRGLAFRFANRWANTHPGGRSMGSVPESMWNAFGDFLKAERVTAEPNALVGERASLERSLEREWARRVAGDSAAVRVGLATDPVFRAAVGILERSRKAEDVFAAASRREAEVPALAGAGSAPSAGKPRKAVR